MSALVLVDGSGPGGGGVVSLQENNVVGIVEGGGGGVDVELKWGVPQPIVLKSV
jgi:hypothetical protein